MNGLKRYVATASLAGAAMAISACAYPAAPRYDIRPMTGYAASAPAPAYTPPVESAPPVAAPYESIEGGALPPPGSGGLPPVTPTPAPSSTYVPSPPVASGTLTAGAAYVIQPGDTISGVGRRFQTPVQNLIDLNDLGPRGTISPGQRVILPDTAVDTGRDPYATGPAPVGVTVPSGGNVPPPPPPPSGNAALPPPPRQPAATAPVAAAPLTSASSIALQWPVRGDILRRFGPVGLGERNNGINIGAAAGAAVNASAAGRVAYVGDDLVGQGLTVLIVHPDGWRTVYGHLGSALVEDGADVRAGQQIGTVGLTAGDGRPSIHFETRRMQGDEPVAIDPLTVLPR